MALRQIGIHIIDDSKIVIARKSGRTYHFIYSDNLFFSSPDTEAKKLYEYLQSKCEAFDTQDAVTEETPDKN